MDDLIKTALPDFTRVIEQVVDDPAAPTPAKRASIVKQKFHDGHLRYLTPFAKASWTRRWDSSGIQSATTRSL